MTVLSRGGAALAAPARRARDAGARARGRPRGRGRARGRPRSGRRSRRRARRRRGHASPAPARARRRGVFAEEEPGVFRNTEASELLRAAGAPSPTSSAARGCGRPPGSRPRAGVVSRRVRGRLLVVARRQPRRARGVRPRDGAGERAARRAAGRARLARRRDGRRRRRRERLAARRAPPAPPGLRGIVFDLPETRRDEADLRRPAARSSRAASSSACRPATSTCSRRSCTTGTTKPRRDPADDPRARRPARG